MQHSSKLAAIYSYEIDPIAIIGTIDIVNNMLVKVPGLPRYHIYTNG